MKKRETGTPVNLYGVGSIPSGIILAKASDIILSVALVNHLYP